MTAADLAPLRETLQNTIENLQLAEKQVQDKTGHHEQQPFQLEKFWSDITTIAQKLSFECTKVCICFSKSPVPTPSETASLLTAVEQAVLSLVSVYYRLPLSRGTTLHSHVEHGVTRAIQATKLLLKAIKEEGGEAIDARYRQSTGIVWQGCRQLEQCSQDNKAAVLKGLQEQNSLVSDAFREISEALEGDGSGWNCMADGSEDEMEESDKWTNEDKDLIGPSVNLIKAAKILYKRLLAAVEKNGSCTSIDQVQELDKLLGDCKQVSTIVDMLILDLYPPLTVPSVEEQSCKLASQVQEALKTCSQSHVAGEAEQPHIEFILKAVEHNLNCMREKLTQR